MNRPLPPGNSGNRSCTPGWPFGRGGVMPGAGGLVGGTAAAAIRPFGFAARIAAVAPQLAHVGVQNGAWPHASTAASDSPQTEKARSGRSRAGQKKWISVLLRQAVYALAVSVRFRGRALGSLCATLGAPFAFAGLRFWIRRHNRFSWRGDYRSQDMDHSYPLEKQGNSARNLSRRQVGDGGRPWQQTALS
jgi:hypothetical protein